MIIVDIVLAKKQKVIVFQISCNIEVTIHELRGEKYQPIHRILMTAKALYMIVVRIDKPFLPRNIHTLLLSIKVHFSFPGSYLLIVFYNFAGENGFLKNSDCDNAFG